VATRFELPFLAPIPHGHATVVAAFRRTNVPSGVVDWLVLDRTARVIYCAERLWGALNADPAAFDDPIAVITKWAWALDSSMTGKSAGSMSMQERGDGTAKTVLFVEPVVAPVTPYR
jgi:hypothetical protein